MEVCVCKCVCGERQAWTSAEWETEDTQLASGAIYKSETEDVMEMECVKMSGEIDYIVCRLGARVCVYVVCCVCVWLCVGVVLCVVCVVVCVCVCVCVFVFVLAWKVEVRTL